MLTCFSEMHKSLKFESVLLSRFELFHFSFNRFEKALQPGVQRPNIFLLVCVIVFLKADVSEGNQ